MARSIVEVMAGWAVMLSTLLANAPILAATFRVVAPFCVTPPSCKIVPVDPPVAAMVRDVPVPVIWMPLPAVSVDRHVEAMVLDTPDPVTVIPAPAVSVVMPPAIMTVITLRISTMAPFRKTRNVWNSPVLNPEVTE